MIKYFFLPLTEFEFITQLSISTLAKSFYPKSKQILLFPNHPRLKGKYKELIAEHFDEIIYLPYTSFSKDWRLINSVKKETISILDQIKFPNKAIWFTCGMHDLLHFWLCRYIRKHRVKKNNILVDIEAFINLSKGSEIDYKKTIIWHSSSLLFASVFSWVLRNKLTKIFVEQGNFPKLYDIRINIEHELNKSSKKLSFNNIPYPLACISSEGFNKYNKIILDKNSLIVFIDSTLIDNNICKEKDYWSGVNKLIKEISILYHESSIYVKFHPASSEDSLTKLKKTFYKKIDKNISAEEIYFFNRDKINGVFSGGSTALITASWLEIPSFDCSELFGFNNATMEHNKPYFSHAPNIKRLKLSSDLNFKNNQINYKKIELSKYEKKSNQISNWEIVFNSLNKIAENDNSFNNKLN